MSSTYTHDRLGISWLDLGAYPLAFPGLGEAVEVVWHAVKSAFRVPTRVKALPAGLILNNTPEMRSYYVLYVLKLILYNTAWYYHIYSFYF